MTKKLYAEVYNEVISDQDIEDVKEAIQNCPVSIISLED
jgi:ferredoxin